jgi:hypothetical protein
VAMTQPSLNVELWSNSNSYNEKSATHYFNKAYFET